MFNFPSEQDVWRTSKWADFLDGRSGNPAGKIERWQLRGPEEVKLNIDILGQVVRTRKPTKTGQQIYNMCKDVPVKVHVIGWRMSGGGDDGLPGFSSFENDCPQIGEATIYINMDLTLEVINPNDKNPNKMLNGYVILLHEMGHTCHWLRFGSALFDSMVHKNNARSERLAKVESQVRDDVMKGPGKYSEKRKLIQDTVMQKISHGDYYCKSFPNELELLNWVEHEGPLCDEWKIARRPAYTAIKDNL